MSPLSHHPTCKPGNPDLSYDSGWSLRSPTPAARFLAQPTGEHESSFLSRIEQVPVLPALLCTLPMPTRMGWLIWTRLYCISPSDCQDSISQTSDEQGPPSFSGRCRMPIRAGVLPAPYDAGTRYLVNRTLQTYKKPCDYTLSPSPVPTSTRDLIHYDASNWPSARCFAPYLRFREAPSRSRSSVDSPRWVLPCQLRRCGHCTQLASWSCEREYRQAHRDPVRCQHAVEPELWPASFEV